MSDGFCRLTTSASSPYFLRYPRSWAIQIGANAAATCEKAILIGTSSAVATTFGAGAALDDVPLPLGVEPGPHPTLVTNPMTSRIGRPRRNRANMMPLPFGKLLACQL